MTVRRVFPDLTLANADWMVEQRFSDEPEEFLGKVSRSEVDWSWRVVEEHENA